MTISSTVAFKIERIVTMQSWRGTRTAQFLANRHGIGLFDWYCCEVWFENGEPKMQIRSGVDDLREAAIVSNAIQMAMDWAAEEIIRRIESAKATFTGD